MAKKSPSRAVASAERQLDTLNSLVARITEKSDAATEVARQSEGDTRNELARNFMRWYFVILLLLLVGAPIYNLVAHQVTGDDQLNLAPIDIIQTYTSVVGPLFGFVIAYYFKNKNDNN